MSISRLARSGLASLLTLVAAGGARAQTVATSSDGWTYTTNITIDSGDANRRISMAMRHYITARYLRMGFVQISGGGAALGDAEGVYTIRDARDSTMTSVMPAQRMATVMGLNPLLGAQASPMRMGEPRITRSRMEDLGPGERMLGHATHHYRATVVGSMEVYYAGDSCTRQLDGVTEMWIAPDVDLQPALQAAAKHFGAAGNVSQLANPVPGAPAMPKGTALRIISTTTGTDGQGKNITVTSTIEIVDFARGPVDQSMFDVPSDYKMMDMRAMLAGLPQGMLDSAIRAGAKTGTNAVGKAMCGAGKTP